MLYRVIATLATLAKRGHCLIALPRLLQAKLASYLVAAPESVRFS